MIAYYAMGGGLGHLTRARAVLHTLGVAGPVAILSASAFARDPRVIGGAQAVLAPAALSGEPAALGAWLLRQVEELRPQVLYIDAFPGGLCGELCGLPLPAGLRLRHVARLLRYPIYQAQLRGPLPAFEITYTVEPLLPEHLAALSAISQEVRGLDLVDPPCPDPGRPQDEADGDEGPPWLVVHAGPAEEVAQLVAYAADQAALEGVRPRIVVVSPLPALPQALPALPVQHLDRYPAAPLFPRAGRIISACGFNIMRQTLPFACRHRFLALPRRFDDQFLRAARRRAADFPR